MIIIVEGPDGAGKTTLARWFCDRYQLQYHHEGPPPPNVPVLDHYGQLLENARRHLEAGYRGFVFDRLALGERVYGPIYRNNDRLGADGWRVFKLLIKAVAAFEVLCLPGYKVALENWESGRRPEMITDRTVFELTYQEFGRRLNADPDQYLFNYRAPQACQDLEQQLKRHDWTRMPLGVTGPPSASYLFVGERGSNPEAIVDLPFFSTEGSSGYLTNALAKAGYHQREIAFVNTFRHDKSSQQLPTWPKLIALGAVADTELTKLNLPHATVPHPQFWKRFHHRDINGYAQQLARCR